MHTIRLVIYSIYPEKYILFKKDNILVQKVKLSAQFNDTNTETLRYMKNTKKLTKKCIQKQKIQSFNKINAINKPQNTQIVKYQNHPNKITKDERTDSKLSKAAEQCDSLTKDKVSTECSISAIKQKLLKQKASFSRVKSEDKFAKYKQLIKGYEKQFTLSEDLKHNIDKRYQTLDQFSKKLVRNNTNEQIQGDSLLVRQKQIGQNYAQLQQKYRSVLIQAKKNTLIYQKQKNRLNELKKEHFKDQHQLDSLRQQYLNQKDKKQNTKNQKNSTISISIQTQDIRYRSTQNNFLKQTCRQPNSQQKIVNKPKKQPINDIFLNQSIQNDLKLIILRKKSQKNQKYKQKDQQNPIQIRNKTQMNWFEIQKAQIVKKIIGRQQKKQQKYQNRLLTYSQSMTEGNEWHRKSKNGLQGAQNDAFLKQKGKRNNLQSLQNAQSAIKLDLQRNTVQQDGIIVRMQQKLCQKSKYGQKNSGREQQLRIGYKKSQRLKMSRTLSEKSLKSVKKKLFDTKQTSQYLNQFRKQVRKQLKNSKNKQMKHQYKKSFAQDRQLIENTRCEPWQTRDLLLGQNQNKLENNVLNKGIRTNDSTNKVRHKLNQEEQEQNQQQIKQEPQTPITKFYNCRKPISPSSTYSKYRFKPTIKMP